MPKKQNWLKNAMKSTAFVAMDITKETLFPDISSAFNDNSDFVKQTYASVKNPPATIRRLSQAFEVRKIFNNIDYGRKNIIDALKTGNYYDKARGDKDAAAALGFDFDFDDLSDFGISDDWEKELEEGTGDVKITKGDMEIINSIEGSNAAMTDTIVNSVIACVDHSTRSARINTGALFEQHERLFGGLHKDLTGIGNIAQSMFDLSAKVLPNIDDNLAKYQTESIRLDTERNEMLKTMLEHVSAQAKTADELESEKNQVSSSGKRFSDIAFGGIPRLEDYFKIVKQNVADEMSLLTMFGSPADMIKMLASNPLASLTKSIVEGSLPKVFKSAASDFNGMITGLFGNVIAKAQDIAYNDPWGLGGTIAKILGVKTGVNRDIDTSKYEKGRVAWDGIARKALTNVIPGYLRRIESALTGKPEIDYNYSNGKWNILNTKNQDIARIRTSAYQSATSELINEMNGKLKMYTPSDADKAMEFNEAVEQFRQFLYDHNGRFFPHEDADYNGIKQKDYPMFYKYYKEISKAYDEFDLVETVDKYGRATGKRHTKNAVRFNLAANAYQKKDEEELAYRRLEASGISTITKLKEYNKFVTVDSNTGGGIGSILSSTDQYGQSVYSYLHNINKELMFWRINYGDSGFNWKSSGSSLIIPGGYPRPQVKTKIDDLSDLLMTDEQKRKNTEAELKRQKEEQEKRNKFTGGKYKQEVFKLIHAGRVEDLQSFTDEQREYLLKLYHSKPDEVKKAFTDEVGEEGYNADLMRKFFKKQFTDANISTAEELEQAISKARASGKKTYEVLDDSVKGKLKGFIGKIKAGRNPLTELMQAPADFISSVLYTADQAVYDMFFKRKVDKDGFEYRGFFDFMLGSTANMFEKVTKTIGEKVIDPLKKKLGISDEFKGRFFDQLKASGAAIGKGFVNANREVWFDPLMSAMVKNKKAAEILKGIAPEEYTRALSRTTEEEFNGSDIDEASLVPDEVLGQKIYRKGKLVYKKNKRKAPVVSDEDKKAYRDEMLRANALGGEALSERLSKIGFEGDVEDKIIKLLKLGISKEKIYSALEHAETDEQKEEILNKIFSRRDIKTHARGTPDGKPYMGNTMLSQGELLFNNSGVSVVNRTGAYAITEPTQIMSSQDAYDTLKAIGFNVPKTKRTPAQDEANENREKKKLLDNHAGGTFRPRGIFTRAISEKDMQTALEEAKKFAPELAAGGVLGGGASLLLGLFGGPLLGAAVGAAAMLTSKSTKMQEMLFGKLGANGERSNSGLISKSIQDTVKKYAPNMGKYAAVGALASMVTPFGIIGGLAAGAGIGYLKTNDEVREKLFGRLKINDSEKKIIAKMMPNTLKGAAIGAAATIIGGPFGLLGNAAVGAAIGMMTSTDEFKNGLLGDIVNGVRHGGVLGTVRDAFKPLTDAANEFKDRIFRAVDKNLVQPIADFVQPAIHALPQLAAIIPRAINTIFLDKFDTGVDTIIKKFMVKPLQILLKPATKLASTVFNVATLPVRGLGHVGNLIRKRQMDTMNADYMTADERMEWDVAHGRKIKESDKFFSSIGSKNFTIDKAKEMRANLSTMIDTQDDLQRAKRDKNKEINTILRRYRTKDGYTISATTRQKIGELLDQGKQDQIPALLMNSRLDGSDVGMSDAQVKALMHDTGLQAALGQYSDLSERFKKARNLSEEDRKAAKTRSEEILKQAGLEGMIDLSKRHDIDKFIKYFDTEISAKESGKDEALEEALENDNHDNITTMTSLLQQLVDDGIKLKDVGDAETIKHRKRRNRDLDTAIQYTDEYEGDENEAGVMTNFTTRMAAKFFNTLGPAMYSSDVLKALGITDSFTEDAALVQQDVNDQYYAYQQMTDEQKQRYRGGRRLRVKVPFLDVGKEIPFTEKLRFAPKSARRLQEFYNLAYGGGKFKYTDEAKNYLDTLTDVKYSELISFLSNRYIAQIVGFGDPITVEDLEFYWSIEPIKNEVIRRCKAVIEAGATDKYKTIQDIMNMSGKDFAALTTPNHFLGTLAGGALSLGKSILGGISSLFKNDEEQPSTEEQKQPQKQPSTIDILLDQSKKDILSGLPTTAPKGDTDEVDKPDDGRDVAAIGDGYGYIKRKSDGSIEPDTSDNHTKQLVEEQTKKKSILEKLQEAQLKASQSLHNAFGEGKAIKGVKKGLGWLGTLLLGGALWNSGIPQKIFNNYLKPIWDNHLYPFIKDKAWPTVTDFVSNKVLPAAKTFVMDVALPGMGKLFGDALYTFGTILPDIIISAIKGAKNAATTFLDKMTGNRTNAGATTTIDSTTDAEGNTRSGITTMTDGNGHAVSWEQIQSGEVSTVYNAEGEKGTVDKKTGNITFKDSSMKGSSYAKTMLNAVDHAVFNPTMGRFVANTVSKGGNLLSKGLGYLGPLGKLAGLGTKFATSAVAKPIGFAAKIGDKYSASRLVNSSLIRTMAGGADNIVADAVVDTAIKGTTQNKSLIAKILGKAKEIITGVLNHPSVQSKLVAVGRFLRIDKLVEWVSGISRSITNTFDDIITKAANKIGADALKEIAKKIGLIVTIVLLVKDFMVGCDQAESILGVTETSVLDEFVAGLINALGNFLILPAIWPGIPALTQMIYKLFGKDLSARQEEADREYQSYVDSTGSTLTKEEYLRKQYSYTGKFGSTISKGFKDLKRNAKSFIKKLKGKSITDTSIKISDEESSGRVGGFGTIKKTGKEYKYGTGFYFNTPEYGMGYSKQNDPSIANIRFNSSKDSMYQTLGDSGCGPAAAVNMIESIYGRGNKVVSAAKYALSNGYKEINGGTKPEFFDDYLLRNGITSTTSTSKAEIKRQLETGKPTILMGKDKNGVSENTPFGNSPHYVTVSGIDKTGKAVVQDPESKYDNQRYDIKDLVDKSSIGVSANGTLFGRGGEFPTYDLTERQLKGLANIIQHEQGDRNGWLAEASLMANLTDMQGDNKATPNNLVAKATGGWFAHGLQRYNSTNNIKQGALDAARTVFVEGKRTLPRYIDEHDNFGDITSATNNGKNLSNKSDRSQYQQNITKVRNKYGSNYTFYEFPSKYSDPFGYKSEGNRKKWGEQRYDPNTLTVFSSGSTTSSTDEVIDSVTNTGNSIGNTVSTIGGMLKDIIMNSPAGKILSSILDLGSSTMGDNSASESTEATSASSGITASGDAARVVQVAQREVSLTDGSNKENPMGSNKIKYNNWYYGKVVSGGAYPWCQVFDSWVANQAGIPTTVIPKNASTGTTYSLLAKQGATFPENANGKPGDLAYFTKNGKKSGIYHTGIVESIANGKINTIEGNTSDQVKRRSYAVTNKNVLLARPNYAVQSDSTTIDTSQAGGDVISNASTDSTEKKRSGGFGTGSKPLSKYGQFKEHISGKGALSKSTKVKLKDSTGFHEVEESAEDREIGKALAKTEKVIAKYGKAANTQINYSQFLNMIIKLLLKVANNSDKLSTILEILDKKFNIKVDSQDISNAQKGNSTSEQLAAIISNTNQSSMNKLNTYADTVGDSSVISIMHAMNAIATA